MLSLLPFVVSAALLVLAVGAMDMLHGGWQAVAGGLMFMGTIGSTLAFVILAAPADGLADQGPETG
jgi:hypothetical protein